MATCSLLAYRKNHFAIRFPTCSALSHCFVLCPCSFSSESLLPTNATILIFYHSGLYSTPRHMHLLPTLTCRCRLRIPTNNTHSSPPRRMALTHSTKKMPPQIKFISGLGRILLLDPYLSLRNCFTLRTRNLTHSGMRLTFRLTALMQTGKADLGRQQKTFVKSICTKAQSSSDKSIGIGMPELRDTWIMARSHLRMLVRCGTAIGGEQANAVICGSQSQGGGLALCTYLAP